MSLTVEGSHGPETTALERFIMLSYVICRFKHVSRKKPLVILQRLKSVAKMK